MSAHNFDQLGAPDAAIPESEVYDAFDHAPLDQEDDQRRRGGVLATAAAIATLLPVAVVGASIGSSDGPVHPSKYTPKR